MVRERLRKLERDFGAQPDWPQIRALFLQRLKDKYIRIPKAMELSFEHPESAEEREIKAAIDEYRLQATRELEQELFKQKTRLATAERTLKTKTTKKAQEDQRIATNKIEYLLGRIADVNRIEEKERDSRIFPMHYSFIVVNRGKGPEIITARYHCRPVDKPAFYDKKFDGLYNARRDSLEKFWRDLFTRNHAVMSVSSFYENVSRHTMEHRELRPGEKEENVVLQFKPQVPHDMTIACLWSHWVGAGEPDLYSFAAITDEPPPEVAAAGHDRIIITLKPEHVSAWLSPQNYSKADLYKLFDDRQRPFFEHRIAA